MSFSNKRRNQVLDAMSEAAADLLNEYCPDCVGDDPPEDWPDDQKELYDLINTAELKISERVSSLLATWVR